MQYFKKSKLVQNLRDKHNITFLNENRIGITNFSHLPLVLLWLSMALLLILSLHKILTFFSLWIFA